MKLQLSVIIVNFNVRHFLEQCLHSLRIALKSVSAEVLVVDNASTDGSVDYLVPLFPEVKWIVQSKNEGFGKANNRALEQATGGYVLFLNPDTLLPEDCIEQCLQFMEQTPDAGALGIKMVDGSGRFLPESKRAFPAPFTSLFKLIGLASLFPKSPLFARYSLGHLSKDSNHQVEVLAGAFMLMRKNVLDLTGGFDEQFFMYGEDIDLSYRVLQTPSSTSFDAWKNYYFAESSIIHFKGESTKRGSLNYVRMFYSAMAVFVKKHYGKSRSNLFSIFIYLAIWLRALVSYVARVLQKIGLPLADALITGIILWAVWLGWSHWIRPDVAYGTTLVRVSIIGFACLLLGTGAVAGLYSHWYSARRAFKAMLLAIMGVWVVYSIMPEAWRFSRGIIVLGGLLSGASLLLLREVLVHFGFLQWEPEEEDIQQTLVAGSVEDYAAVANLISPHTSNNRLLGRLSVAALPEQDSLMTLQQWALNPSVLPAKELIFCISPQLTMQQVLPLLKAELGLQYKFHYRNSASLVGSSHSNYAGETLALQVNYKLGRPIIQGSKRKFDVGSSILIIVALPLLLFFVKNPPGLVKHIVQVLGKKSTWIGYCGTGAALPPILPGILGCNALPMSMQAAIHSEARDKIDHRYALHYHYWKDLQLLQKGLRYLGSN